MTRWLLIMLLAVAGKTGQDRRPGEELFLPDAVRAAAATAAAAAMVQPLAAAGLICCGGDTAVWDIEPPASVPSASVTRGAPVLEPAMLAHVEDGKPVADINDNPEEVRAYYYALGAAHQTSADVLFRHARHDVRYVHLQEDPQDHRGQLVHVEGYLRRLERFEPRKALKEQGVRDHYEGWLFDRRYPGESALVCIVFTELPPEFAVGDRPDYAVAFAGYFFKKYRFRSGAGFHEVPLLLGRTIRPVPEPASAGTDMRQSVWFALLLLGGVTAALILSLGLWFRRSDRQVQARLARIRSVSLDQPDPGCREPRA